MKITLVSGNRHKFDEMSKKLALVGIELFWKQASLNEPDGLPLKETAIEKARQAFELVNAPVVTDDTGVFFDALDNFPGAKAKRCFEDLGFNGLLGKLNGKDRAARFVTFVCFTANGKEFHCFKGEVKGSLTEQVHNPEKDVLPYEKIFIPEGFECTMSDISREEKNTFSHRAQATKKFSEWWIERSGKA